MRNVNKTTARHVIIKFLKIIDKEILNQPTIAPSLGKQKKTYHEGETKQ